MAKNKGFKFNEAKRERESGQTTLERVAKYA